MLYSFFLKEYSKCKVLQLGMGAPLPIINLNGIPLEYVSNYKYLGVELNVDMDSGQQWLRVQMQISTLPYLLRKMRIHGWSKPMLLSAYRAYGLRHFAYSAPLLMSCSEGEKEEMAKFQRRILRIIGVTQDEAALEHKLPPITKCIDNYCRQVLGVTRIINDPAHPITCSLPKRTTTTRSDFEFVLPFAYCREYYNSFLVANLRQVCNKQAVQYT